MLQSRGRVTAGEVAEELEISERTARRDLDALGMAGMPVYSQQGRNGGWRLAGGGRTDLSGLTAAEARALFLLAGPAGSATPEVKAVAAAGARPARALPPVGRGGLDRRGRRSDGLGRGGPAETGAAPLDAPQRAVIEGEQVELGYVGRDRTPSTRVVHPLGLATKGWAWYLVADTASGLRTFRLDRVNRVEPTGEAVVRPEGFDLAEAWRLITDEVDQRRSPVEARAAADPRIVGWLRANLGSRLRIGPAGPDGRVEVELRGHTERSLAGEIATFGVAIEVLEPLAVREALADLATELTAIYRATTAP